jgi:hypothetical protein
MIGDQCAELDDVGRRDSHSAAATLLEALRGHGLGCTLRSGGPYDLPRPGEREHRPLDAPVGVNTSLYWDAALPAHEIVVPHRDGGPGLRDADLWGVNGRYEVEAGNLAPLPVAALPLCLYGATLPRGSVEVSGPDGAAAPPTGP